MDAARAREQLRRRYLFSPDAEASLDGRGCAGPGRRCPGRSEPRRGPGPGARTPRALRPPAARPVGGPGFRSQGAPVGCTSGFSALRTLNTPQPCACAPQAALQESPEAGLTRPGSPRSERSRLCF